MIASQEDLFGLIDLLQLHKALNVLQRSAVHLSAREAVVQISPWMEDLHKQLHGTFDPWIEDHFYLRSNAAAKEQKWSGDHFKQSLGWKVGQREQPPNPHWGGGKGLSC